MRFVLCPNPRKSYLMNAKAQAKTSKICININFSLFVHIQMSLYQVQAIGISHWSVITCFLSFHTDTSHKKPIFHSFGKVEISFLNSRKTLSGICKLILIYSLYTCAKIFADRTFAVETTSNISYELEKRHQQTLTLAESIYGTNNGG